MSLFDTAKNLLLRLNKSQDLLGDLDKQVVKLQTQTPLDPYRKRDIVQLLQATSGETKKDSITNIMDQITKEMSGAMPSPSRIAMYDSIQEIRKKIPILSRATRIWVDNILSPDDINKKALRIMIDDETEIKKEEFADLIREFRDYVKYLELESTIDGILTSTLLEGDRFVEITTEDNMLNVAFQASNIKLKEEQTDSTEPSLVFIETPELIPNSAVSLRIHEEESDFDMFEKKFLTEAGKDKDDKKKDKDKKDKDEKDDKKDKEDDSEIRPEVYEKIPDQPFDVRIAKFQDSNIAIQDIKLREIDPRNIIVLHKNKWVMGYLYVEQLVESTTSSSRRKNDKYPEEKSASDQLAQKLYIQVKKYLSNKSIDEIPEEFKDLITKILMNNPTQQVLVRFIPVNNMQHFKYPSSENDPYGESYFADLLYIIKLYLARLTSSTLYRLARVGKHLVFYIDVTNTHDARKRIESVKKSVKKREITADDLGSTDAIPTIMSTFEDFYIPTRGGQRMVDIDTLELGTMADVTDEDNFYLKNILTGIEIPPSYLGIEEFNSTKSTLSQESMVFARSIIRMQKIFSAQYTSLLQKIYRIIHAKKLNSLYLSVICGFSPPAAINVENTSTYYNKVRSIYSDLEEMGVPEDYIRRRYMPEIEWETIMLEELQRKKEKDQVESRELGFENPFESGGSDFGGAGTEDAGQQAAGNMFGAADVGGGEK